MEICIRREEITVHSGSLVPSFWVEPASPDMKGAVSTQLGGGRSQLTVTVQCNGHHDGGKIRAGWSTGSGTPPGARRVGMQEGLLDDVTPQGSPEGVKEATQLQGKEGFQIEGMAYAKTQRMKEE